MKRALLIILCALPLGTIAEDRHLVVYKSIGSVYNECRQYLGYPRSRSPADLTEPCLDYCGGVQIRFWDIERGTILPDHTTRYLEIDLSREEFFPQTEQCFERVQETVPEEDRCRRTQEHVACFAPNATINFDRKFFFVKTKLQHQRTVLDCVGMLQIGSEDLETVCEEGLLNDPRGRRLVRCFLVREKLYSEANGVDYYRILMESDQFRAHRERKELARNCVARLQREFLDRDTLAARIAAECFGSKFWNLINSYVESANDQD